MVLSRVISVFKPTPVQCSPFVGAVLNRKRSTSTECSDGDTALISLEESRRFVVQCMEAVGTPKCQAEALANLLVEADYRGHYNQGIKHLGMYVCDVKTGVCDACATPKILHENKATAWVDGQNGLGVVVGQFCMDLAIKKAKDIGVGWVTAKGSNHYGIASMYSSQALECGLLGLSFSSTSPLISPTRSKKAAIGTNPITLAAPANDGDSFLLDMTISTVNLEKIEEYKRKKKLIPEGWAQDREGRSTTDPEVAYEAACLMPLGGAEINLGYNGRCCCLSTVYSLKTDSEATPIHVQVSNKNDISTFIPRRHQINSAEIGHANEDGRAHYGPNIRKWGDFSEVADLGQSFVAVNPNCFAPGFEGRLSKLLKEIRDMEPADPCKPVMVAGDPERLHMAAVDKAGGVRYEKLILETCQRLSDALQVAPLKPLS